MSHLLRVLFWFSMHGGTVNHQTTSIELTSLRLLRRISGKDSKGSPVSADAIDPVHFALANDAGIWKQNPANNPYPIWNCKSQKVNGQKHYTKRWKRDRQTITTADTMRHLTTPFSLHTQADPKAKVWELAIEIDNKSETAHPSLAYLDSLQLAEQIEEQFHELSSFHTDKSRHGRGAYCRMLIDRTGYTTAQAIAIIKIINELVKREFPAIVNRPQFDSIKGLPALSLPNPAYDQAEANEVEYIPWPEDRSDWNPTVLYGERTNLQRYEHAKRTYSSKTNRWEPIDHLEKEVTTQTGHIPAPCNYPTGADVSPQAVQD